MRAWHKNNRITRVLFSSIHIYSHLNLQWQEQKNIPQKTFVLTPCSQIDKETYYCHLILQYVRIQSLQNNRCLDSQLINKSFLGTTYSNHGPKITEIQEMEYMTTTCASMAYSNYNAKGVMFQPYGTCQMQLGQVARWCLFFKVVLFWAFWDSRMWQRY